MEGLVLFLNIEKKYPKNVKLLSFELILKYLIVFESLFLNKDVRRVRKHLTRDFLCAVLDLSGTHWPLLIPEYSGIKWRGMPFPGLRNPGISHYGDKYPLPFYEPDSKR